MKMTAYACLLFLLFTCAPETDNTPDKDVPEGEPEAAGAATKIMDTDTSIVFDFNDDGSVDVLTIEPHPSRDTDGFGLARDLVIRSKVNGVDAEWFRSPTAILPSGQGGMMGDPFQKISFNKGRQIIAVEHAGGSRDRWRYVHGYRYRQGSFQLVSVIVEYGTPCVAFEQLEYMPSTGEAFYESSAQTCKGNDEPISKTLKSKAFLREVTPVPSLHDFKPGENKMPIPGTDRTMMY